MCYPKNVRSTRSGVRYVPLYDCCSLSAPCEATFRALVKCRWANFTHYSISPRSVWLLILLIDIWRLRDRGWRPSFWISDSELNCIIAQLQVDIAYSVMTPWKALHGRKLSYVRRRRLVHVSNPDLCSERWGHQGYSIRRPSLTARQGKTRLAHLIQPITNRLPHVVTLFDIRQGYSNFVN